MKVICILFVLVLSVGVVQGQKDWRTVTTNVTASFRGLSVVDDQVAWLSGSQGWVGVTQNGGTDWTFKQVEGFDKMDFRSLYAFDANRAIIANAGSPASILITNDGGNTWKEVYRNDRKEAFFDGIDFWNDKVGMIYGDPIDGKMFLVKTEDGGHTWKELPDASRPALQSGEASFAASGTGIRCIGDQTLLITTGGTASRVFSSPNQGSSWTTLAAPIVQGKSSTGIFSIGADEQHWIIVGGDFEKDTLRTNHVFFSREGGRNWHAPERPTGGYRECVEFVEANTALAVGPGGADITRDGGATWQPLADAEGIHVVRKARKGKLMIMAGGKGKIKVYRP